MKKFFPLVALMVVCAAISCSGPASKDSTKVADSSNQAKVDSGSSKVASTSPTEDSKFAVEAASGGMAEVELGKMAQDKASDSKVKEFGTMMIADHTKANNELKALAAVKNITLPAAPGESEQKVKDDLMKKSGKEFDKAYVDEMVSDHKNDVKLFEDAKSKVKDPDLLNFIDKTLPVLKMHLQHVESIHKNVK